jgi:hypothetical protein
MLPFFYAVADEVDGSALQDAVEAAYFAFRTHPRDISQATSCACNACAPDAGSQVNREAAAAVIKRERRLTNI